MSKTRSYRINEEITALQVRIVGLSDDSKNGIYSIEDALRIARECGSDLIEIAPDAKPPVCKVYDYSKFLYNIKKKEREARKKLHQTQVKEIHITSRINNHDLNTKTKQIDKFLSEDNKVKVVLFMKGTYHNIETAAQDFIEKILGFITNKAKIESLNAISGRKFIFIISRKK